MTLFDLPKNIREKLSYMGLGAGMALIAVPIITSVGASPTGGNPDPYHKELAEKRLKLTYPWYLEGLTPQFIMRCLDDTHKPWIAEQSVWVYLWKRINSELGITVVDPACFVTIMDNQDTSRSIWFSRADEGGGNELIVTLDGVKYERFFDTGIVGLRGLITK